MRNAHCDFSSREFRSILVAAVHARACNRELVEPGKTKGVTMNTKCEKSLTPRDVYSSILQPQRRVINSESFTSDSYERTFERTCEHSPNYESNLSFDKSTGNISSTADQFIISNDNSLENKQSKTQLEDFSDGNRKYETLQKRRSRSKSTRICKGAPRDREPSRLPWKKILNLFKRIKQLRGM